MSTSTSPSTTTSPSDAHNGSDSHDRVDSHNDSHDKTTIDSHDSQISNTYNIQNGLSSQDTNTLVGALQNDNSSFQQLSQSLLSMLSQLSQSASQSALGSLANGHFWKPPIHAN
jgi:hypothetical protein